MWDHTGLKRKAEQEGADPTTGHGDILKYSKVGTSTITLSLLNTHTHTHFIVQKTYIRIKIQSFMPNNSQQIFHQNTLLSQLETAASNCPTWFPIVQARAWQWSSPGRTQNSEASANMSIWRWTSLLSGKHRTKHRNEFLKSSQDGIEISG